MTDLRALYSNNPYISQYGLPGSQYGQDALSYWTDQALQSRAAAAGVQSIPQHMGEVPQPSADYALQRQQGEERAQARASNGFVRGLRGAWEGQLGSSAGFMGAAVNHAFDSNDTLKNTADALGLRTLGDSLNRYAAEKKAKADMYAGDEAENSFREAIRQGRFGDWAVYNMGSATSSMGQMALGAIGARALIGRNQLGAIGKYAPDIGAFASSYLPQAGGNLERIERENPGIDKGRALGYAGGFASPQAAADVLPEILMARWAANPAMRGATASLGHIAKRTGQALGAGMAGEAVTGGAQNVLEQSASQLAGRRPVSIDQGEVLDSAAAEAIGGAHIMGAGGAARGTLEAVGAAGRDIGKLGKLGWDKIPQEVKDYAYEKGISIMDAAGELGVDLRIGAELAAKTWKDTEGMTAPARAQAAYEGLTRGYKASKDTRKAAETIVEAGEPPPTAPAEHRAAYEAAAAVIGDDAIDARLDKAFTLAGERGSRSPMGANKLAEWQEKRRTAATPGEKTTLLSEMNRAMHTKFSRATQEAEHVSESFATLYNSLYPIAKYLVDQNIIHPQSPDTNAGRDVLKFAQRAIELRNKLSQGQTSVYVDGQKVPISNLKTLFTMAAAKVLGRDQTQETTDEAAQREQAGNPLPPRVINDLQNLLEHQFQNMTPIKSKKGELTGETEAQTRNQIRKLKAAAEGGSPMRWFENNAESWKGKDGKKLVGTIRERRAQLDSLIDTYVSATNLPPEKMDAFDAAWGKEVAKLVGKGDSKQAFAKTLIAMMAEKKVDPSGLKNELGIRALSQVNGEETLRFTSPYELMQYLTGVNPETQNDQQMRFDQNDDQNEEVEAELEAERNASADLNQSTFGYEMLNKDMAPVPNRHLRAERLRQAAALTNTGSTRDGKPAKQWHNDLAEVNTVDPTLWAEEQLRENPDADVRWQLNTWVDTLRGEMDTEKKDLEEFLASQGVTTQDAHAAMNAADAAFANLKSDNARRSFSMRGFLRDHTSGNEKYTPEVIEAVSDLASLLRRQGTYDDLRGSNPDYGKEFFSRHRHGVLLARNWSVDGKTAGLDDLSLAKGFYDSPNQKIMPAGAALRDGLIKVVEEDLIAAMEEAAQGNPDQIKKVEALRNSGSADLFQQARYLDVKKMVKSIIGPRREFNELTHERQLAIIASLFEYLGTTPLLESVRNDDSSPLARALWGIQNHGEGVANTILGSFTLWTDGKAKITVGDVFNAASDDVAIDDAALKQIVRSDKNAPDAVTVGMKRGDESVKVDLTRLVRHVLQENGHDAVVGSKHNRWQALSALYHGVGALQKAGFAVPPFSDPVWQGKEYLRFTDEELPNEETVKERADAGKGASDNDYKLTNNALDILNAGDDSSTEVTHAARMIRDRALLRRDENEMASRMAHEALLAAVNNTIAKKLGGVIAPSKQEIAGQKDKVREAGNEAVKQRLEGTQDSFEAAKERAKAAINELSDMLSVVFDKSEFDTRLLSAINKAKAKTPMEATILGLANGFMEHYVSDGRFGTDSFAVDIKNENEDLRALLALRKYVSQRLLDMEWGSAEPFVADAVNTNLYGKTPDLSDYRNVNMDGTQRGEQFGGDRSLVKKQNEAIDLYQFPASVISFRAALDMGLSKDGIQKAVDGLTSMAEVAIAKQMADERGAGRDARDALRKREADFAQSDAPGSVNVSDVLNKHGDEAVRTLLSDAAFGDSVVATADVVNASDKTVMYIYMPNGTTHAVDMPFGTLKPMTDAVFTVDSENGAVLEQVKTNKSVPVVPNLTAKLSLVRMRDQVRAVRQSVRTDGRDAEAREAARRQQRRASKQELRKERARKGSFNRAEQLAKGVSEMPGAAPRVERGPQVTRSEPRKEERPLSEQELAAGAISHKTGREPSIDVVKYGGVAKMAFQAAIKKGRTEAEALAAAREAVARARANDNKNMTGKPLTGEKLAKYAREQTPEWRAVYDKTYAESVGNDFSQRDAEYAAWTAAEKVKEDAGKIDKLLELDKDREKANITRNRTAHSIATPVDAKETLDSQRRFEKAPGGSTWDKYYESKPDNWKELFNERYAELVAAKVSQDRAIQDATQYANEKTFDPKKVRPRYSRATETSGGQDQHMSPQEIVTHIFEKLLGEFGKADFDPTLAKNIAAEIAGDKEGEAYVVKFGLKMKSDGSTAYHEAMHVLMKIVKKMADEGNKNAQKVRDTLEKAVAAPWIKAQVIKSLKDHPEFGEIEKDIERDPEELLAYAFELWSYGKLNIGERTENVFQWLARTIASWLGITDSVTNLESFFENFAKGDLAKKGFKSNAVADALGQTRVDKIYERAMKTAGPLFDMIRYAFGELGSQVKHLADKENLPMLHELEQLYTARGKGYLWRVGIASRQLASKYVHFREQLIDELGADDAHEALKAALTDARTKAPKTEHGKQVYEFIKEINRYAGRDEDHIPTILNYRKLALEREEFEQDFKEHGHRVNDGMAFDKGFVNLMDDLGISGLRAEGDWQIRFDDPDMLEKYSQDDPDSWMRQFINSTTKATEKKNILGEQKPGDPYPEKVQKLMLAADNAGMKASTRREVQKFIEAAHGQHGKHLSPKIRELMKDASIAMNVLLLPLAVFTALVEPFTIAARVNSISPLAQAYAKGLGSIGKTVGTLFGGVEQSEMEKYTEKIGAIEYAVLVDSLGDIFLGDKSFGKMKKVNDWFFKWNFLDGWTRAMRVAAVEAGIDFITEHYQAADWSDNKDMSTRFMNELGLKKGDIIIDKDGKLALSRAHDSSMTKEQEYALFTALNILADESAIRANTATGSMWMADPRFMWIAHMKRHTWAWDQLVLQRTARELMDHGNWAPTAILMASAPVALGSMMFREAVRPGNADWLEKMSAFEMWEYGAAKAGLNGKFQVPIDIISDPVFGARQTAGPIFSQALGTLSKAKNSIADAVMMNIPGHQLLGA